ncbi:ATP-binding cassette superfamily, partial [Micromonas pusilla CCMP1545]
RKQAAVDGTFVKRMAFVLQIVVPSLNSKEAALLAIQTLLLVSRSFISLRIARKGGDGLQAVMEHSWKKFGIVLGDFFVSGVAASVVNSALKYMTNSISLSFRQRLTTYVHQRYLSDQAYYRAAVLRVGNLDNADQRIADDLNQFCHTASDLFSRTFKPLLDVILSTMRMGENMGYGGLVVLYSYFLFSGAVIRAVSPPFSEYIARSQKLEGDFRRMHSRLITHAEEVAFLDGSDRERAILDQKLEATTTWQQFYFYLQFKQGVIDQYFVKYFASMIGWPVLAFPFLTKAGHGGRSPGEIAARYRESDTLIQSASSSVGDLMMVYKKLQRLSGFTARVVELLEANGVKNIVAALEKKLSAPRGGPTAAAEKVRTGAGGVVLSGAANDGVRFDRVSVYSPDGRLLVKDVSFDLKPGENLFVTGANGAGKTSLFRVLAGLWEPASGVVTRPDVFYVPQKPYLVSGSLRDQVMYPRAGSSDFDDEIIEALSRVNLLKLVNAHGLDRVPHDWADVLSGGEKQRVGLARLYFHKPSYAVLDEATSAINPDEEGSFYDHLGTLGITAFSIAHRMELKKFHHSHLHFHADGTGGWTLKRI